MKEYVCARCGKKIVSNQYRRFCSVACSNAYRRTINGWGKTAGEACQFNQGVCCEVKHCTGCGWNPKVEARRKEALACEELMPMTC